ncbi:9933_t:CDS:2 [Cetraspora pellucida]|uniref:9933_t:CDS:1 n=1 Tax=Cetraspora pellucida TaxID=1433469 RepID=A0A9N9EN02_9GLOM|nr:9933_t:CDS:2 [Cetraspora pellucida]
MIAINYIRLNKSRLMLLLIGCAKAIAVAKMVNKSRKSDNYDMSVVLRIPKVGFGEMSESPTKSRKSYRKSQFSNISRDTDFDKGQSYLDIDTFKIVASQNIICQDMISLSKFTSRDMLEN